MRHKLVLAVSAVAVGAAFAAVPAFAQNSSQGSAQQSQYPVGRPMNDGGYQAQSQNSNNAQRIDARENRGASTAPSSTAQNSQYPIGRGMNDGGFPAQQAQNNAAPREQRTGSAQNTQRAPARSAAAGSAGPTNYAYDPYSQGPYNGPGPYYNYAGGPGFAGGPMNSGAIGACQARFRSYDPNTGTYLGFDGVRHPCP
jgi:hypothetical protein